MAKSEDKEAVYEEPATKTNLAAFYEREKAAAEAGEEGLDLPEPYQVPSVTRTDLEPRFEVSDEDRRAFVGVDEMYQNYPTVEDGEHTDKPRLPTEGVEAETWKRVLGEVEEHPETDPGEVDTESQGSRRTRRATPPPPPGE